MKYKKIYANIFLMLVSCIILIACTPSANNTSSNKPDVILSTKEFTDILNKGENAALNEIGGKIIQITGTVGKIGSDLVTGGEREVYASLIELDIEEKKSYETGEGFNALFFFAPESQNKAEQLKKGQKITIQGVVEGGLGMVVNCKIINQ